MAVPDDVYLYHLTSMRNLPSMVQSGRLKSKTRLAQESTGYENIAYADLQDRRARTTVPCAAGGCLHDYVPFYFAPRSPMLYAIHEGNVEGYDDGQEPLVYILTKVARVIRADLTFAFTDRHAVLAVAQFYDDPSALDAVDHTLMREKYWHSTDRHPDRRERRQAEFLIYDEVPLDIVGAVAVMSETVKEAVDADLAPMESPPPVIVRPRWYF